MAKIVADLHIHSKSSRATSSGMELETLSRWARIKGIDLLGTGDFSHPRWFSELQEKAIESDSGFLQYGGVNFVLSCEVSCVYPQGGRLRRIHLLLLSPSLEIAQQINERLARKGSLLADGRPTFGISAIELCELVLGVSEKNLIIPAHAWTPWFSLFGSQSGFDSLKEAFGEYEKDIYAIETGLSSDPAMNWRLSQLDRLQLVSNSDSHSPEKIGREANVFELDRLTYGELYEAIRYKEKGRLKCTYEFYPEEGKYHFDGHRACKVSMSPQQRKSCGGICPVCKKPLTVGVLSRVEELADRPEGFVPKNAVPYESLVPLKEVLSEAMGSQAGSKKVEAEYFRLVKAFGNEFAVLHAPYEKLKQTGGERLAEAIRRVERGKVKKVAGYDGEYGRIIIFDEGEKGRAVGQSTLGEF
ncbi:MAG: endonuclease Q family protein [Candidatus Micrarchaeota archaeon]|nr:endonuclease Q family protein [Candidatus Micrarchaeota archaeon]